MFKRQVDAEEYVRAFKASDTYEEVATTLNLTLKSVKQRYHTYRKRGVRLLPKASKKKGIDIEILNRILEQ